MHRLRLVVHFIGAQFWLAGFVGACRARRDGNIGAGFVKFALAACIGGFFATSAILAVRKFAGS
jgi:hypothetical protein